MKIIFYLPLNTDKPKFVAFLVFVCTTASFIAQISSFKYVSKWDAILAPVAKQWIAKDIPSHWTQSKCTKIAIHWFSKIILKKLFYPIFFFFVLCFSVLYEKKTVLPIIWFVSCVHPTILCCAIFSYPPDSDIEGEFLVEFFTPEHPR